MINPKSVSIEEIINTSVQFIIPKYQREYMWGKSEAIEFIEDMKGYIEGEEGKLFLGTIIFDGAENPETIKIVDGQQRITTIILLLIACRNVAKKLNPRLAERIQSKIAFEDSTTAVLVGPKLYASESIGDIFKVMSDYEWDGNFPNKIDGKSVKRQVNRIKPVYEYFHDEICDYDMNLLSRFLKTIYESYVIRIDIKNEMEAFNIFERTNARGVDLEASDLLKNYLFAQGVEGLDELWPQIVENSEGTILRMLKYYYVAKNGYVSKSNLYKKIKIYADSIGAETLARELYEFSAFYYVMRTSDQNGIRNYFESIGCTMISSDQNKYEKIHIAIEGLRLFKIMQVYPLIYAAINCLIRSEGGENKKLSEELISLLNNLEKYHFINNAICERIGNEIEKPYAEFCIMYDQSKDFHETTMQIIDYLRKKIATEEEFVSRFIEISYSANDIPLIVYIFDRINNYGLHPGQRIPMYNPDQKILRKNHNIEHLMPQTPEEGAGITAQTMECIDNIGNLLVISFRTNSRLGNMSPIEKINKLKGPLENEITNMPYIKEFISKYENVASIWDKDKITGRAIAIAKDAYNRIWAIKS